MPFTVFLSEYRSRLREHYLDPSATVPGLGAVRNRLTLSAQAVLLRTLLFDPNGSKEIRKVEQHIRQLRDQRLQRRITPPEQDRRLQARRKALAVEQETRKRERERRSELLDMFIAIYEYALLEAERDENPIPNELEQIAYRHLPEVAKRYLQRTFALDYLDSLFIIEYEDLRRRHTVWRPTPGAAAWLPTPEQFLAVRRDETTTPIHDASPAARTDHRSAEAGFPSVDTGTRSAPMSVRVRTVVPMLRSDFDNHPLWALLNDVEKQLATIAEQNDPAETPDIERIRFQIDHVRGFRHLVPLYVSLFSPSMLESTQAQWAPVSNHLASRIQAGLGSPGFVASAATEAENALVSLGPWPRPYAKGAQVNQMNTLFEGLMEEQRKSIERLVTKHEEFAKQIEDFGTDVGAKRDEAVAKAAEITTELTNLETQIDADKTVITDAVAAAEKSVKDLTEVNTTQFTAWKKEREQEFKSDFDPLRTEITTKLESANTEYDDLLHAKDQYQKLVSKVAGHEVASNFEAEAKWGRAAGITLYAIGVAAIIGGGVPLAMLLVGHTAGGITGSDYWAEITLRIAIGLLAASAATVLIRLGGRFIGSSNSAKRMELELKAIGPFLANVQDQEKIDKAMIDLVDRAFGKAYVDQSASKGTNASEADTDDPAALELAKQTLGVMQDLVKRLPTAS